MSLESTVSIGLLEAKTVGFIGIHGAAVAGTHGIPIIAVHVPNGIILNIGILSIIEPTGFPQHRIGEGVALKTDGHAPNEHMHIAPVVAIKPIIK